VVTPIATAPAAPNLTKIVAGSGKLTLHFNPPSTDGGSTITSYTASCTSNGSTNTAIGTTTPITVTGLTNGASYTCSITATNAVGTSGASTPASLVVKPASIVPILNILLD
jgi:hypothetical protein